jgi:hypothetical protein
MIGVAQADPVPAITERDATGEAAEIFEDIRNTLDVEVVNLIWRHLATIPGGLAWVWHSLKPLYRGPAIGPAEHIRSNLMLPRVPPFSSDTLVAAGLDVSAVSSIRAILDSYRHTNALALVCFSAFLARFGTARTSPVETSLSAGRGGSYVRPGRVTLPRLVPIAEMSPSLANLIHELNGFGEDSDPALVASMYRHLAHWPAYLALVRTLLVPLHECGELRSLVDDTRRLGGQLGASLGSALSATVPGCEVEPVLQAIRRFARHPIARMTGICALISQATS